MDGRFTMAGGQPASHHMHYDSFGRHFLEVFDHLTIVGRLFPQDDPSALPVTGAGVDFLPIPAYAGPGGFASKLPAIRQVLAGLIQPDTAFILRVPGTIPLLFSAIAALRGVPFATQCVADPIDQLEKGSVNHPLRSVFRAGFAKGLAWQCRSAGVGMYVTREALQRRYPPGRGTPSHNYTDLVLSDDAFRDRTRTESEFAGTPTIVNVGMMVQLYKGQDTLIEALALCRDKGFTANLRLVGDGAYRAQLEEQARLAGLADRVTFVGKLAGGAAVRDEIDRAHLFCLPSRQEGLPRALMEAMARAAPAIATDVGGNGELLDESCLVPPNRSDLLADALLNLLRDPTKLAAASARNLDVVGAYRFENMIQRRNAFYRDVEALYGPKGA